MKDNLKTFPNCEWIIHQPRTKERIDDAYCTIIEAKRWKERIEKELIGKCVIVEGKPQLETTITIKELLGK